MAPKKSASAGVAARFTARTEKWIPDAFVFALIATAIVVIAGLLVSGSVPAVLDSWGKGFWELLPFTLQMSMVIITGYVVASAPVMQKAIAALAGLPK